MNFVKFEEKANDFLQNSGIITFNEGDVISNLFTVQVISNYKEKSMSFRAQGIGFEVCDTTLDSMFDKAWRILKSYGPKATRERNKEVESSNSTEQGE